MRKVWERDTLPFSIGKMLYSIKDREEFENLKELVSLQTQVKEVRLQDKLGEQNYRQSTKTI